MSRTDKTLTKSEKRLLIAVGLFVVIVLGIACWWEQNNILPVIAIPTPVMPNPNAYDLLLQAAMQMKFSIKLHNAIGPSLNPPTAPVTTDLEMLSFYLRDRGTGSTNQWLPVKPTLTEMQTLVRANAAGFITLHRAFQQEFREPPVRSFDQDWSNISSFHRISRCLNAAGMVKSASGDWPGAMDDDLDAIQLGELLPRGGEIGAMQVGVFMQSVGCKHAWTCVPHLNATQARDAAWRLEKMMQVHVALSDTLLEEKYSAEASMLELFQSPDWRNKFMCLLGRGGSIYPAGLEWRLLLINKRAVIADYAAYMDASIANARLPYAVPKTPPVIPTDPITTWVCRHYAGTPFKETLARTQNALLDVTLALHAYQLEHAHYPARLSTLVPAYLHAIPADPFALTGPLRYRLNGQQYVLYSVGPDGNDDGGVPSVDGRTGKPGFISDKSTGDIVAGVNVR